MRLLPLLAVPLLLGCGARSELGVGGVAGAAPADQDPCPSAVSGPMAMAGSCSTRDARARVPAPSAPHVIWGMELPLDSTGMLGPSHLATDASGSAYVVTTGEMDQTVAAVRRVRAADGSVVWTAPITPASETSTPIVLSNGGVDLMGYDPGTTEAMLVYDAATGARTSTTFGLDLYYAPPDQAVGADGSLYVTHFDAVGTGSSRTFVSRVSPAGAVVWTSVDLSTIGPMPTLQGDIFPSTLALAKGDLVVIAVGVLTEGGDLVVVDAFDAASGALRWSTPIQGDQNGGPVVRADGTIAVLVSLQGQGTTSDLVTLDPATGAPSDHPVPTGVFEIAGVTRDGAVLTGADAGSGVTALVALDPDGAIRWTAPGDGRAIIASDGTVISSGVPITAVDGATGATRWTLSPPEACLVDLALTSEGGLVGLTCDGTLFGASD